MRKTLLIIPASIIVLLMSGCGYFQSSTTKQKSAANSNKTIIEQVSEKVAGTEKSGIPECDNVLARVEKMQQANDDSYTTLIEREAVKQAIYSQVRGNLDSKTPAEKQQIAEVCKQIGANFMQKTENKK